MDNSTKGSVGPGGQTPQLQLPSVTEFGLESGLGGIFIDVPNSQSMLMEISFRAGNYLCLADKPEQPHFLEHLLMGANKVCPSKSAFKQAVSAKGAYSNAFTGSYNVTYHFRVPDFDWQRVFDLMLAAVSQPLFLPEEFQSEREAIRQEHKMGLDAHSGVIQCLVAKRIGLPAVPSEERLESLDSISLDDLKDYYSRTYTLGNSRLIIAGYLPQDRQALIKQKLASLSLPAGDRLAMPSGELTGAGLVYIENTKVKTIHYNLIFTCKGLPLEPEDEIALSVIHHLLLRSGDSRIYTQARSQGLIYSIGGGFGTITTSSYFELGGQVTPDKFEPLLDLILFEIKRLLAGDISDDDIIRGKDYLRGKFQLLPFTSLSWGVYYSSRYLNHELLLSADYPSRLEPVDRSMVVDLARKIFGLADWTLGLLGNVSEETRNRIEAKLNRRQTVDQ